MKYCPECLREATVSLYGGYGCESCGVLQYSNAILLDSPDKEAQKKYVLRSVILRGLNIDQDTLENLAERIEEYYKRLT